MVSFYFVLCCFLKETPPGILSCWRTEKPTHIKYKYFFSILSRLLIQSYNNIPDEIKKYQ